MVRRFRKKPAIVEAFQWGVDLVPNWFAGCKHPMEDRWYLLVAGRIIPISDGDYIVKGVGSIQYVCNPEVFEKSYQEIFLEYNQASRHAKSDSSVETSREFGKALVRCPVCREFLYFRETICPNCNTPYKEG